MEEIGFIGLLVRREIIQFVPEPVSLAPFLDSLLPSPPYSLNTHILCPLKVVTPIKLELQSILFSVLTSIGYLWAFGVSKMLWVYFSSA